MAMLNNQRVYSFIVYIDWLQGIPSTTKKLELSKSRGYPQSSAMLFSVFQLFMETPWLYLYPIWWYIYLHNWVIYVGQM